MAVPAEHRRLVGWLCATTSARPPSGNASTTCRSAVLSSQESRSHQIRVEATHHLHVGTFAGGRAASVSGPPPRAQSAATVAGMSSRPAACRNTSRICLPWPAPVQAVRS